MILVSINGYEIGQSCFPNNERIFKHPKLRGKDFDIALRYEYDIDVVALIIVTNYIQDNIPNAKINLIMLYVPYSRMDRKITNFIFSLKYFCKIINDLKFENVFILDPHSNVTPALLNNCREIPVQIYIDKILEYEDVDYVFFPDNGAHKKYSESLTLPNNIQWFYGNKKRDLQNGEILDYELVNAPSSLKGKYVLIIDDLCAGGRTCYEAALKLKSLGAEHVFMYVSHCENTIYKGKILKDDYIDKVFTTDSLLTNWESDKIIQINYQLSFEDIEKIKNEMGE